MGLEVILPRNPSAVPPTALGTQPRPRPRPPTPQPPSPPFGDKVYPAEEYAYALLYFTGSDHFNRSMRHFAKAKGYSLSDHGLVRAHKVGVNNVVRGLVNLVPAKTEQDIFKALGLDFKEPIDRNCEVQPKAGGEGTLRVC